MKKLLLVIACFCFLVSNANAQVKPKALPTDSSLRALANKYVHTPIKRTVAANGDVFLQRDLTPYLQANIIKAPEVAPAELDKGHDHKDAMLRLFLNRPHPSVATLNKYFLEAAAEWHVPVSILKAVGQVQSNWAQVSESVYGSWGVTGLIENPFVQQISRAASLLHVEAEAIRNDARTNIRAAAALLSAYQKDPGAATLEDWFPAVQSLTGLRDETMRRELALRIFDVIKNGSKTVTLWGEIISVDPVDVHLPKAYTKPDPVPSPSTQRTAAVDYPLAVPNFTSCNFNNRPTGSVVKYYFVHYVATGTYQGAISWFKDCSSSVSAHYVIRNGDGEISQVVAENDRAWSQGVTTYNDLGIGVEHEVLATNLSMWESEPMLVAAANLCINVCNRRAIPKVRRGTNGDPGIYGHSDVRATDCPNLTDARWTNFLSRINTVNVAPPLLYSIGNPASGTGVIATWRTNLEPNLVGYRLYYANSDALTGWSLAADETKLTAATTSVSLDAAQFLVPPAGDVYHFKLTAVVSNGSNPVVESTASDVYSRSSNASGPKVLIVDGFDRTTGSFTGSSHQFVTSYFKSLRNKASLQISSVANEKVEDGTFVLNNYNMVVWFVGDESSANIVFSTAEKNAISSFLNGGGKLIVSGSEIAYNFGRVNQATTDTAFLKNYLKASYLNDGSSTYTPATGIAGTPFAGLNIPFGIVYPEDFPDAINAVNGSVEILNYAVSPNKAGVAYKGNFSTSTTPGALIYLSFTLETAADTSITAFMGKALAYFDVPVLTVPVANEDAATTQTGSAKRINVLANDYDNGVPINPAAITIISPPGHGTAASDASGNITYTSDAGFSGSDTYQYRVQNVNGQFSNPTTVSITVVAAAACNAAAPEVDDLYPKRDLRGAWVSTVSNIDWPSSRTLNTGQQQAELIRILDTLSKTGINTVYLQVRPECDALYTSTLEPWSYWLTNAQGTAPNPLWDPLLFAITEAHARGMQLHAWLNPYRAKQSTPVLAPNHVAVLHPDWTFASGTLTMLNPGLPQVRNYLTQVIADIAGRYDIDGIHFDDYFYPSAGMTGQDTATFAQNNPTGIAAIEDWRRNNVNLLIAKVYDTLAVINAATNRNIQFGVSPFGIWKSGTPAGITGTSSYSAMYCDPIAWLQAGKVDYIAPQLYWKITGAQDYNALSKWWNDQGIAYDRHIYPGLALYKMSDANNWAATEIENQVIMNRDQSHEQVKGQVLFSTQQLMANIKGVKTLLQANQFRYPAFAPAMSWKDPVCPNAPLSVRKEGDTLRWDGPAPAADGDLPKRYVVYRFADATEAASHVNDGKRVYKIVSGTQTALSIGDAGGGYFMITALDKNNNESELSSTGVLPLTGLTLDVKLSGNTARIHWATLTETATRNFEVERSEDGRNFTRIATAAAAGTSVAKREYSIQDFLSAEGLYYYRIKSIDIDGRAGYSTIASIFYHPVADEVILGPNPFVTGINISHLTGVKQLDIIDQSGRIVFSKTLNNQQSIRLELPHLPGGLYHLKLTKADGQAIYKKVVKL
ncbi:MAG: family 10 glycosylhydrolase [Williamsia sp.]|nr:family 10 glycosylhydrolase [Williamsia sp.]